MGSRSQRIGAAHSRQPLTPRFFASLFVAGEAAAVALTALLAKFVYIDLYLGERDSMLAYAGACLLLGAMTLLAFHLAGLSHERALLERKFMPNLFFSIAAPFLCLLLVLFLLKSAEVYSRVWMSRSSSALP